MTWYQALRSSYKALHGNQRCAPDNLFGAYLQLPKSAIIDVNSINNFVSIIKSKIMKKDFLTITPESGGGVRLQ